MSRIITLTGTLVVAIAIAGSSAACGRRSGPPDLSPFLGTWNVVSGSLAVHCSNGQSPSIPVTDPTVFVPGTAAHLLGNHPACPVHYNVAGNIAMALAGQTCKHPKAVTDMHIGEDTFTVTDRTSAARRASGRLSGFIDVSMAMPVKCTYSETATYVRAGS